MCRDPGTGLSVGVRNTGQRDKRTRLPHGRIRMRVSNWDVAFAVVAGVRAPATTYHQHTRKGPSEISTNVR